MTKDKDRHRDKEPIKRAIDDLGAQGLCDRLGLELDPGNYIQCPVHTEHTPSCHVTDQDGRVVWYCHGCQASGDALALIAAVHGLDSVKDFRAVLELASELVNITVTPTPTPVTHTSSPVTPAISREDVIDLLRLCTTVSEDDGCVQWLQSRCITVDPRLCRALPDTRIPSWAHGWRNRGLRLILPLYDARGSLVSLRARQIHPDGKDKARPITGHTQDGKVLASPKAVAMLRGETTPDTLVVTEGEPDYLSWASSSPEQAVIGIVNIKGWDQSIADRIPTGTTIYVRTDPDTAGHKYADAIVDSLADRGVVVWRRDPQDSSGIDDNDALMRNGSLPSLSQGLICVQGGAADPEPQDDIIPRWHDQVLQYGIAFGQPPTAKIPVPWAQLAITLGGGWEIGVQALIGPTGAGKSQVATHIALHAATHGHPTLLCSLELSRSMAIAKLLAAKTGIAWSKQLARDLTDDQYGRLAIALQHLYDLPLDLISNTDRVRSVEDIEAYARKFVACYEQRPLIVVDYLSYLTAFEGKEIRQATQAITSSLDALASELSATVLLVAATSRQYYDALRWDPSVDHKPGEVPVWRKHAGSFVALAKESGGVEYSAHAIIALAVEVGVEHDTLHLGIAKNRSGRCSIGGCWTRLSLENGICEEL